MGNIKKMEIKNKTPIERLETLLANDKLTCDEVIDFIDEENYILINRIAEEDPDDFYPEYAEFLDFYVDVFGPNEDFMDFVEEHYGDNFPFLFQFSDDCCRRRDLACMSEYKKDNARTLANYIMKINAKRVMVAHLDNDVVMTLDIPKNLSADDYGACCSDAEDICMHFACFGGKAYLTYEDSEKPNGIVINGFISLDGIMANISAKNMASDYISHISNKDSNFNDYVKFENASCIFKKPQYGKPKESKDIKDISNKDDGKMLRFPNNNLN